MDKFHLYLHFPTASLKIQSRQEGETLIEQITMLIDRADCEKGAKLYYEESNMDSFLSKFLDELRLVYEIELGELSLGTLSFEESLLQLLRDATAENWEQKPKCKTEAIYKTWDLNSEQLYADFPVVFKEILERELETEASEKNNNENKSKTLLINLLDMPFSFFYDDTENFVPILKDVRSNNSYPILRHIYFVGSFTALEKWFLDNQTPRSYNTRDFRHIEGHPDYIKGKSPVLGGIGGISHIASLLQTAITDQREAERASKDLINYDEVNNCYVWFETEGDNPQNQYHGYHLVKPNTHIVDNGAVDKIPERVIALLEYRRTISQNL